MHDENLEKNVKNIFNLMLFCEQKKTTFFEKKSELLHKQSARGYTTFFDCMFDVLLNYATSILNEMTSSSRENRAPLPSILEKIYGQLPNQENGNIQNLSERIRNYFVEGTDNYLSSMWLSFSVDTFSVFEKWISQIYDTVKKENKENKENKKK
ncbi:hypothetical protein [Bombella apis]|uniref:hypothetical protein n=1 Tax=Bombella apis TaxID=1785988 RepID=UPI0024A8C095|nr:hypothetical protein [Bombella apis]